MQVFNPPDNGSVIPLKHARVLSGPTQVAFDITSQCNFRCRHCFHRSNRQELVKDELGDRDVMRFVRDLAQMRPISVCLGGGEGLLRLDLVCRVARELARNKIQVSLLSNGWLLSREVAQRLRDSGLTRVQISLDGATAESHAYLRGAIGSFRRAVEALEHLQAVNMSEVGVAFTPTRRSCHEVKDVYRLCKGLGVHGLQVQPLIALGQAWEVVNALMPSPWQYRNLAWDLNELRHTEGAIAVQWVDPIDHLIRFSTVGQHCSTSVAVQANGNIALSPLLPITVGNVRRHLLSEYWNRGLPRIWEWHVAKSLAQRIRCMRDLAQRHEAVPVIWFDELLTYDLIDGRNVAARGALGARGE